MFGNFRPDKRNKVETLANGQRGSGVYPLVCDQFSVFYGNNEAVKKVSMKIDSRKVTAIIGPSGCGKSTLLRAVNRMNDLIPHTSTDGRLIFDGVNIYSERIDVVTLRKRIGMVFQKPNPFPKSIYDNIAYGIKLHHSYSKGKINALVEKSLRAAALWDEVKDRLDDNALGLSGGQQQRLCIARAVAIEPEVLLMDEPTSALDPKATYAIEELVDELKKDYTILIVTHNMQQAARISDKTAFLFEGDLIEYNQTNEMFTNPKEKKTEEYLTGRFG